MSFWWSHWCTSIYTFMPCLLYVVRIFFFFSFYIFEDDVVITLEWAKMCHDSIDQRLLLCVSMQIKFGILHCQTLQHTYIHTNTKSVLVCPYDQLMNVAADDDAIDHRFDPSWRRMHFKTMHRQTPQCTYMYMFSFFFYLFKEASVSFVSSSYFVYDLTSSWIKCILQAMARDQHLVP